MHDPSLQNFDLEVAKEHCQYARQRGFSPAETCRQIGIECGDQVSWDYAIMRVFWSYKDLMGDKNEPVR